MTMGKRINSLSAFILIAHIYLSHFINGEIGENTGHLLTEHNYIRNITARSLI